LQVLRSYGLFAAFAYIAARSYHSWGVCALYNRSSYWWTLGFSSRPEERGDTPLSIEGQLPDWLEVDLVRNGPALFTVGEDCVNHWFDGLAKLHKLAITGGAVFYRSRFIESRAYKNAMQSRRLASQEFGMLMAI